MARHFTFTIEYLESNCQGAQAILSKAYDACESFHVTFGQLREEKPTEDISESEQDTLRAMLVFACAGLDSAVKLLVRESLYDVIDRDKKAAKNFTDNVRTRLQALGTERNQLADVLTATNPRQKLIQLWQNDLVAGSLQSTSQLSNVAEAFNLNLTGLSDRKQLDEAFRVRNQIVHEMDIDHTSDRLVGIGLPRRARRQNDMERLTAVVLDTAASFLKQVNRKLEMRKLEATVADWN